MGDGGFSALGGLAGRTPLWHPSPHNAVEGVGEYLRRGRGRPQGHFRSTHCFPPSSYSCLEIHICWNVPWEKAAT